MHKNMPHLAPVYEKHEAPQTPVCDASLGVGVPS